MYKYMIFLTLATVHRRNRNTLPTRRARDHLSAALILRAQPQGSMNSNGSSSSPLPFCLSSQTSGCAQRRRTGTQPQNSARDQRGQLVPPVCGKLCPPPRQRQALPLSLRIVSVHTCSAGLGPSRVSARRIRMHVQEERPSVTRPLLRFKPSSALPRPLLRSAGRGRPRGRPPRRAPVLGRRNV